MVFLAKTLYFPAYLISMNKKMDIYPKNRILFLISLKKILKSAVFLLTSRKTLIEKEILMGV